VRIPFLAREVYLTVSYAAWRAKTPGLSRAFAGSDQRTLTTYRFGQVFSAIHLSRTRPAAEAATKGQARSSAIEFGSPVAICRRTSRDC